jgi:hypothetical protein
MTKYPLIQVLIGFGIYIFVLIVVFEIAISYDKHIRNEKCVIINKVK